MPRDPRVYITVHEGMPDHPKIEGLSDAAFRLLVTAWCWCSRNLTDGFIPDASWSKRGSAKSRQKLIEVGLVEVVSGGVRMHDYTEHQRTADEVADIRAKRAEAGRKGGLAKAAKELANATASAKQDAKQTASKSLADTETDTHKLEGSSLGGTRKRGCRLPANWIPDDDVRQQMMEEHPDVDFRTEHAKFVDHFTAAPGQKGVKVDWNATWRNWIRRAAKDAADRRPLRPVVDEYKLYN